MSTNELTLLVWDLIYIAEIIHDLLYTLPIPRILGNFFTTTDYMLRPALWGPTPSPVVVVSDTYKVTGGISPILN